MRNEALLEKQLHPSSRQGNTGAEALTQAWWGKNTLQTQHQVGAAPLSIQKRLGCNRAFSQKSPPSFSSKSLPTPPP